MLHVETQDSANALIVSLEGRFTGDGAEDVWMLVTRGNNTEKGLAVDLTEVIFVDSAGEATLSFFGRLGAKFVAEDAYTVDVSERLLQFIHRTGQFYLMQAMRGASAA